MAEHKNPTGFWSYSGNYSVELAPDAPTDWLPDGVSVSGNVLYIQDGAVGQDRGGINFAANGNVFHFGYKFLQRILGEDGEIIWENENLRS